jgi:rhodanese-related sulfurtransferase
MEIRQTTPPDAYETLQRDPDAVYLDVRTPEEFAAGHPAGALNVPVLFFRGGGSSPNPDFVAGVQRLIPPATPVLVGCQAGGRSQRGAELLVAAGYSNVSNVRGGFGGARDETGRVVIPGWREAGLPVETGVGAPKA